MSSARIPLLSVQPVPLSRHNGGDLLGKMCKHAASLQSFRISFHCPVWLAAGMDTVDLVKDCGKDFTIMD